MRIMLLILYVSFVTSSGMAQANIETKNYNIEDFDRIIAHGGHLNINHSDKHTLKVIATKDCIELVKISVSSKTLYITIEDLKTNNCKCKIEIGTPILNELIQKGGGDIIVNEGFSPTNSFECTIKGGGNIDVSKLSVNSFHASIEDGGKILLHARKELEGNILGGGLIEYSGDPHVKSTVSGGGTIRKK